MASKDDFIPKSRSIRLEISDLKDVPFLLRAHIREGLSEISCIRAEFLIRNRALQLRDLIGKDMVITLKTDEASKDEDMRSFHGVCVTAEYVGDFEGCGQYIAEIRPWLWFLSRCRNCRIFQSKTAVEVISEVFDDHGFSDYELSLSDTYPSRDYCVQYRETDLDFVSRLMEEEGIYYCLRNSMEGLSLVLMDNPGAHGPVEGAASLKFHAAEFNDRRDNGYIFEWAELDRQVPGKITLNDFEFRRPGADEIRNAVKELGQHPYNAYEHYDYPGHYRGDILGDRLARIRMEAQTARAVCHSAASADRHLSVGGVFELTEGPRDESNGEFLITSADFWLQTEYDLTNPAHMALQQGSRIAFDPANQDTYRCHFQVMPSDIPFRAPLITPWPEIAGMQTAIVTGPGGEEIHTDEYGRVKVKFHWDRSGGNDDKSSCWLRTVMPWTGKNWGMIAIPRIGQEVVVQFEEGDPDRPVVTGMLYNADTMPPYELPANKTMTGMTTRSSKGGNASTHHELVFEDKNGAEYVRFQSERDYNQIVKNNATINIGFGHEDLGDLSQNVNRNKTEVVGEVRTAVIGLLEDLSVGLVYDETVGVVKSQAVGVHKSETVGLPLDYEIAVDWAVSALGVASTLYEGGKYANEGAAMTALNALKGAAKPGKSENIHGLSELIAWGDREVTVKKSVVPLIGKPGDYKTVVEDGNVLFKVDKGNQVVSILKGDRQIGVAEGDLITGVDKGDYRVTVAEKNHLTSVLKGDKQLGVEKGDLITGVDTGNYKETVKKGDYSLKCDLGKVEIEAMKSITLKVGMSKVVLDQKGVTINGNLLTFDASAVASLEGPMVKVSADAICTVDGTPVLIN